jgi:uncharacterized membrane protein YtjA (UPF0391 family)
MFVFGKTVAQHLPKTGQVIVRTDSKLEDSVVNWALTFLLVALLAACIGFSGIADPSAGIARVLFLLFLGFAIVTLKIHPTTGA